MFLTIPLKLLEGKNTFVDLLKCQDEILIKYFKKYLPKRQFKFDKILRHRNFWPGKFSDFSRSFSVEFETVIFDREKLNLFQTIGIITVFIWIMSLRSYTDINEIIKRVYSSIMIDNLYGTQQIVHRGVYFYLAL